MRGEPSPRRHTPSPSPRPLDEFGDVLTLQDICAVLGKGARYGEHLVTLQNQTGVRQLPDSIDGIKHRYRKEDVRRFFKLGRKAAA